MTLATIEKVFVFGMIAAAIAIVISIEWRARECEERGGTARVVGTSRVYCDFPAGGVGGR